MDTGETVHPAAAYRVAEAVWLGEVRFTVDRAGFDQFLAFLGRLPCRPEEVAIGLEATGHYHRTLVEQLTAAGYAVVLLDPYRAAQFRRSEGRKAKTDRIDARALARFVAVQAPQTLARLHPTEQLVQLRELTRFRSELVETRSTALRRLRGVLDLAFPELLGIIKCLGGSKLLALLAAYPTAAAVAAADREQLLVLLRGTKHAQRGGRGVDALIAAARASVALRHGEATLALKVRLLVRQVLALDEQITELEAAIAREFAGLGYAARDFPVGTPIALATLVAEAGNVHRFASSKQFLAHFGWCPADTQSGQSRHGHPRLSKAGNRFARRVLWMLALFSVGHPRP